MNNKDKIKLLNFWFLILFLFKENIGMYLTQESILLKLRVFIALIRHNYLPYALA